MTQPTATAARRERFAALDTFRGVAALGVALFHLQVAGWFYLKNAYLLVDFFFLLSGFVLAHVYFAGERTTSADQKLRFISHRLARLLPLHIYALAALCLYFAVIGRWPVNEDGALATFFQHLFLLHSIGFNTLGNTWNFPSWSISAEFWVNVLFVLALYPRVGAGGRFLLALLCYVLVSINAGHLDATFNTWLGGFANGGLLRCLGGFLLGLSLYDVYTRLKPTTVAPGAGWYMTVAEVCILSAVVLLFAYTRGHSQPKIDFAFIPVFALLILVFALQRGQLSRVIALGKPLGDISYSIYLNHILVVEAVRPLLPFSVAINVAIIVITLLGYSTLTYWLVERPAMVHGRDTFYRWWHQTGGSRMALAGVTALVLSMTVAVVAIVWTPLFTNTIAAADLPKTVRESGYRWDGDGNLQFTKPLDVRLEQPVTASEIDISLDNNDRYRVSFFRGVTKLSAMEFGPQRGRGLQGLYRYVAPLAIGEFDRVEVAALDGDGFYALGHLVWR